MTATPSGMTYADYLKLDTLLSAQTPLSDLHDEMLFIIIHQTKELWLKQMLHELGLAIDLVRDDQFAPAYKAMSRISRIQAVMTLSWDVLATLTPVDYSRFRDVLGTSSGFQSVQFRELEFRLGLKDPKYLEMHGAAGPAMHCSPPRSLSRACGTKPMRRSLAPGSSWMGRATASRLPGLRFTATVSAGSTYTSSPRSWSTSTTPSPVGVTSMC